MSHDFYPLTVLESKEEIGGMAKTVMFEVPDSLKQIFSWRAGQHLSFRFNLKGEEQRRSYSISSSPVSSDPLRITVKRVKGGLISNHINDNVKKGDVIEVMPSFGSFCLDAEPNKRRTHYFFGAGSGITPLFSMLHSVLCNEPLSVVHLAYGNKNAKTILFNEFFSELEKQYPNQLHVHHVISDPSMWSGFKYWRKGLVDKDAIEALIAENPPYAQDAQYFICGPGAMNKSVKSSLMAIDVPTDRIHMESYGNNEEQDDSVKGIAAQATILLDGKSQEISIQENQTVLEAAKKAGLKPPYSCQSGVCGACRAHLFEGSVHMRATTALEQSDIEKGDILTCQSVATSSTLRIEYK